MPKVSLTAIDGVFAVCRLPPNADVSLPSGTFASVTRTNEETSVVCRQELAPPGSEVEGDWRCFRCVGTLAFEFTGILQSIARPLAEAEISIFAVSTFDTDYLLVKSRNWETAVAALSDAGFDWA